MPARKNAQDDSRSAFRGLLPDSAARAARAPLRGLSRAGAPEPPGAGSAVLAAALRREAECPAVLVVAPGPAELESLASDLRTLMRRDEPLRVFPMLDLSEDDPVAAAARLSVLSALSPPDGGRNGRRAAPKLLVATCVQALMQPSPDPARTEKFSLKLAPGSGPGPEELRAWLEKNGYRREPEVYEAGVYAAKGGITDVWPAAAGVPSRIEHFGDETASIRTFDPATQRSAATIESLAIPPRKLPVEARRPLTDFMPDGSAVVWCGGPALDEAAGAFAEAAALPARRRIEAVRAGLDARAGVRQFFLGLPLPDGVPETALPFRPVDDADSEGDFAPTPDWMENHRRTRLERLAGLAARTGSKLFVCLDTPGSLEHLAASGVPDGAELRVAPLSGGVFVDGGPGGGSAAFLAQSDLYGVRSRVRNSGGAGAAEELLAEQLGAELPAFGDDDADEDRETAAEAIAARLFDRFSPGDFVVHLNHGIGRYLGTEDVEFGGAAVESMVLEYAGGTKLYVPMAQAHLVSRYSGTGDSPVRLHALSGRRWAGEKAAAAAAVQALALSMLRRQARRKALPGRPFAHETPYLEAFEASFPYRETPGQAECIRAVREDMESPHPMDRLVCGDAGYGKTEIALRAAFVCAMQGRQVALLVPTTVLAQQHAATFRARLADYPLVVAVHSRFATRAEREAALAGAADGTVDILVGTHGILGPDVRFKDLGLVIIDEEQRFGVRDKERLKDLSEMVDVLTLSATPIPRSLYLGLTGARDLSLLRTPPPGRVAAETRVVRDTDETVKAAVLREISRGGQVFFLHNRVMTIGLVESRLRRLLPGVRIAVAHGRLSPREVKSVVDSFARGESDLLLSTTIIENGIDIPRANTIVVDRADRFGIADLYQLRGRVGRGATKAYAWFLVPSESLLTHDAKERLEALSRASRLGGGVSLALRDLSLRGAGNLLGAEQSGHIGAVGFQLYSKLLRHAVARLKGEEPPKEARAMVELPFVSAGESADPARATAMLPRSYVEDDARRVEFHRRLSECSTEADLAALRAETEDRFGPAPPALARLFRLASLRIAASDRGIDRVEMRDGALRMERDGVPVRFRGALPRPAGSTPDELLSSVERLVRVQPLVPRR